MSNYSPIHFCYERDRERLGSTQCGNDELLRMIADCQSLERSDRDLGDGAEIGARFTSD
jgi:hypothetical protein